LYKDSYTEQEQDWAQWICLQYIPLEMASCGSLTVRTQAPNRSNASLTPSHTDIFISLIISEKMKEISFATKSS